MTYLQLSSTNPNFSFILRKNPSSGMNIKACRKGRLFGWYTDARTYNIYFRDSDTEVSYGSGEEFEYMDVTRYNAPMFVINAFHELLNHMKKADEKDVVGYENILKINQMKCKRYNIDKFKSHFLGYEFKFEELVNRNFRIEIKTKNTIRELMNLGQLMAIFNALLNNDIYVTEAELDKYMDCLRVIDSPYYIRHLFKCYFLYREGLFRKYKVLLEKSEKEKLELVFGNNLIQRINTIKKYLDFKSPIIDIGCGRGDYIRELAPKLKGLAYHAIDTDTESIETVKRLCKRKKIENVATWASIDEFVVSTDNSVILMTEVIEHMSKDDAASLIAKVLQWPFRSIIITTPNKDFNINYQILEEETRYEDHKFEMTKVEFRSWIEELIKIKAKDKTIKFFDIGDNVNDLQPTLAVIIGS